MVAENKKEIEIEKVFRFFEFTVRCNSEKQAKMLAGRLKAFCRFYRLSKVVVSKPEEIFDDGLV